MFNKDKINHQDLIDAFKLEINSSEFKDILKIKYPSASNTQIIQMQGEIIQKFRTRQSSSELPFFLEYDYSLN